MVHLLGRCSVPIDGRDGPAHRHRCACPGCARELPILRDEPEANRFGRRLAAVPGLAACAGSRSRGGRPSARRGPAARRSPSRAGPRRRSSSTSSSRGVRPAGFSRVARRGPRGRPRAPRLAQPPGDDRRRRPRAQPLELVERPAELLLVAGIRPRERGLVGTAGLVPEGRGAAPSRRRAERRTARAAPCGMSSSIPARRRQRASSPSAAAVLLLRGEPERVLGRREDAVAIAGQPGDLGPRSGGGAHAHQLVGRLAQRPGLLEELLVARIAASRANEPEHDEPADARQDGGSADRRTADAASAASSQRPWSSSARARYPSA